MPLLCMYADLNYKREISKNGFTHVPPASLRYRVSGTTKMREFMDVGKRIAHEIENSLHEIGKDWDSFDKILDFGCGCGRTLTWFRNRKPRIYGTDIDADAIRWASEHLDFGTFTVNSALPPLEYIDNSFDLIYAISVFTHLNEDYQFQWLKELERILKSRGILILTVQGKGAWKGMSSEDFIRLQKNGFIYMTANDMTGFFPSWYQVTFHNKEYVLDKFGKYFKVLDYIEKGINNHQDLVILQKT